MTTDKTAQIAALNDQFRSGINPRLGQAFMTPGISSLSLLDQFMIAEKVRTFAAFSEDNDPYAEHDFGAFEHGDNKVFWKIDYYDKTLTAGSRDPADAAITTRVLTIMLASEY